METLLIHQSHDKVSTHVKQGGTPRCGNEWADPLRMETIAAVPQRILHLWPKSDPDYIRRVVLEFIPSSHDRNLFWYVQFSVLLLVLGEVKEKAIWSASTKYLPCITETFHPILTALMY